MLINRLYTYPLLNIKDNKVITIYSYITLPSNTNLRGDNNINNINNYILINLLIKDIEKVVIRGKVLKYLYDFWKVLKKDGFGGVSGAGRSLLVKLRLGVYNDWFLYLLAN